MFVQDLRIIWYNLPIENNVSEQVPLPDKEAQASFSLSSHVSNVLIYIFAILPIFIGLLVIVGWHTQNPALVKLHETFTPMPYNTALVFLFSGLGLLVLLIGWVKTALVCSSMVLFLGLLTSAEYILDINLGMRQYFLAYAVKVKTLNSVQVAPNSAIGFVLMGLSLIFMVGSKMRKSFHLVYVLFGSFVFGLGAIAFFGYVMDIESAYRWGSFAQMGLLTAASFVILGLGTTLFAWKDYKKIEKETARLLPIPIGVGIVVVSFLLWHALLEYQHLQLKSKNALETQIIQRDISFHSELIILGLEAMASRAHEGEVVHDRAWVEYARSQYKLHDEIEAIYWINASHDIKSSVFLKGAFNDKLFAQDLISQIETSLREVRKTNQATISNIVEIVKGEPVFVTMMPLLKNSSFGYLLGVVNLKAFLKDLLAEKIAEGFQISLFEDGKKLFSSNQLGQNTDQQIYNEAMLSLFGRSWKIRVFPNEKLVKVSKNQLPNLTFYFGLIFAGLFVILMYFVQLVVVKNKKISKVNQKLYESNQFLDSIIENIPNMIFVKQAETLKFLRLNKAGEELMGVPREELVNKSDHDLLSKEEASVVVANDQEILERKEMVDIPVESFHTQKMGKRLLHTKKIPILSCEGQPQYLLGISEDITERTHLENLKEQYNSLISHELRTPLNIILQSAMTLKECEMGKFTDSQQKMIDIIHNHAKRLANMVTKLLEIYRLESDKSVINIKPVNVASVLEEELVSLKAFSLRQLVDLESDVSNKLPLVMADIDLLHQVLMNLVSNAVRFAKNKVIIRAQPVRINKQRVDSQAQCQDFEPVEPQDANYVLFSVKDDGPGIPKDIQRKLFTAYMQYHRTSEKGGYKGTGLGLVISQKMIEKLQGHIWVDNQDYGGAHFHFTVPVAT